MSPNNTLPQGFVSMDEAVALIKSDTDANPIVDMDWMINRVHWIDVNNNFRIPKIRRLEKDEIYKTRRGKYVFFENIGEVNVTVRTPFEKELLKQTIRDKYRELKGKEYREKHVRSVSTVADDAEGKAAVQPRSRAPIAKEGDAIGGGQTITTNGANI